MLCELDDVNGEYMWVIPKRTDSEWEAGVGRNSIISATKKYEKLIGKTCVYAISYYEYFSYKNQMSKLAMYLKNTF